MYVRILAIRLKQTYIRVAIDVNVVCSDNEKWLYDWVYVIRSFRATPFH